MRLYHRYRSGLSGDDLVRTAGLKSLRQDETRRPLWVAAGKATAAKRGYIPLSDAARIKQRAAVVEYNRARPITDAMRANMSAAHRGRSGVERFDFQGEKLSITDISERFGVDRHVLRKRINAGWSLNDAVFRTVTKKPRRATP